MIAAGTDKIDAVKKCCINLVDSSNCPSSNVTRATIIDPATVAIPAVIKIRSSLFVSLFRYGLINKGASTCPTNTLAAPPNPIGPPILNNLWQIEEKPLTINGSIPQCHNIAVIEDITIMNGRITKANIKPLFGSTIPK